MRYPIAIEPRTERSDYGVVIPDLPGAFSAGDTLDEAIAGAEEAGLAWIDTALDAGEAIPEPSPLEAIRARPEFAGWILSLVTINPAALDDTVERVNITLPRRVLRRLDEEARAAGETRSGYIAKLAFLSIYDDGLYFRWITHGSFDAEGSPHQKTPIIEKGILRNFLYDNYTARKKAKKAPATLQEQDTYQPPASTPQTSISCPEPKPLRK